MAEGGWLVIAVGSNIEPTRNLPAALDELGERLTIVAVSTIYETEPVGAPDTPDFWNSAVLVRSELGPSRLKLEVLRPIEAELGRTRGSDPNAPRTMDLDIVLWSGGELEDVETGLRLPDPGLTRLAHLVLPVSELVPEWRDPDSGRTLAELAERFRAGARQVRADGWPTLPGGRPA